MCCPHNAKSVIETALPTTKAMHPQCIAFAIQKINCIPVK